MAIEQRRESVSWNSNSLKHIDLSNNFDFQIQMLITRVSAKSPGISPGSYFTLNKAFLVSVRIELLTKWLQIMNSSKLMSSL